MLARRLLMFAAILLVVTTISATLAPSPPVSPESPSASDDQPSAGASRSVERTIDASRERPATVEVEVGDVLSLVVRSDEDAAVELRGLAQIKPVSESSDAVFNVLPTRPDDYPVVLLDAEQRTVGTVRVIPRER